MRSKRYLSPQECKQKVTPMTNSVQQFETKSFPASAVGKGRRGLTSGVFGIG